MGSSVRDGGEEPAVLSDRQLYRKGRESKWGERPRKRIVYGRGI